MTRPKSKLFQSRKLPCYTSEQVMREEKEFLQCQQHSLYIHFTCHCKGTYASVRPYRHTYGNYGIQLQTWTRVIINIGV